MEINVEKDKQTGETKIVSASPVGPDEAHQRGFKVYDDGTKVVYEVHSGGTVVENGVHKLSSKDVDELMQKAGQSNVKGGYEIMTVSDRNAVADGNLSHMKEQMLFKEAKLEMVHKPNKGHAVNSQPQDKPRGGEVPEASADQPVTMIFMGYQSIDDEEETKKVLGYDETIKAELVLIDEDDEKSLREKTVTDISTMDGNAAELVSGRPLSDTTEPSSPEGKEESLPLEAAPGTQKKKRCQCCIVMWTPSPSPLRQLLLHHLPRPHCTSSCNTVNWKWMPPLPCSWVALISSSSGRGTHGYFPIRRTLWGSRSGWRFYLIFLLNIAEWEISGKWNKCFHIYLIYTYIIYI